MMKKIVFNEILIYAGSDGLRQGVLYSSILKKLTRSLYDLEDHGYILKISDEWQIESPITLDDAEDDYEFIIIETLNNLHKKRILWRFVKNDALYSSFAKQIQESLRILESQKIIYKKWKNIDDSEKEYPHWFVYEDYLKKDYAEISPRKESINIAQHLRDLFNLIVKKIILPPLKEQKQKVWRVKSFSSENYYIVKRNTDSSWECSCPHFKYRKKECKHIKKIKKEITIKKAEPSEFFNDLDFKIIDEITSFSKKRNWKYGLRNKYLIENLIKLGCEYEAIIKSLEKLEGKVLYKIKRHNYPYWFIYKQFRDLRFSSISDLTLLSLIVISFTSRKVIIK